MSSEEILHSFYDVDEYEITKDEVSTKLIPSRLRGETLSVDLKVRTKVIVEANKRITARHIRELESSKIDVLKLSKDYLINKVTAKDVIDSETGEVLLPANSVIDTSTLELLEKHNISQLTCLYINELERGPYISNTLRNDPTSNRLEALVEIYRMMRPGEPPTRDSAEQLFQNLFFNAERYDLSDVGRMKFNRRLNITEDKENPGILDTEDILNVMKGIVNIRDGHDLSLIHISEPTRQP